MSGVMDSLGIYADSAWFTTYVNNPPPEAQFRVNGATPLRRVQNLLERYEAQQRAEQIKRYHGLLAPRVEKVEDADETLGLIPERLDGWLAQMDAGTLDPQQVLRNIAQIPAVLEAVQQIYDDTERDAEAAAAMVDMAPAEYAEHLAERFPTMRNSAPYITEAWLRGEAGAPDPLGEQP